MLQELPNVGPKSAEQIALWVLKEDRKTVGKLAGYMIGTNKSVTDCSVCHGYTKQKEPTCPLCLDESRKTKPLMVVAEPEDVVLVEQAGVWRGQYHVLGGKFDPDEGVGPADLNVADLLERVAGNGVREVIIATGNDNRGEITKMMLARMMREHNVEVTELSTGLPAGADLEFVDEVTLQLALERRQAIEGGSGVA